MGFSVPPTCVTAVRWSIVGAAIKCYGKDAQAILDFLSIQTGVSNMSEWNASVDFEKVRKLVNEFNV